MLSAAEAHADLARLVARIGERYSYLALVEDGFSRAVDHARAQISREIPRSRFALVLMEALASLRDGHVRLHDAPDALVSPVYAPCLFGDVNARIVAFRPGRHGFIDDLCPFVRSIDGVAVSEWMAHASRVLPADTVGAQRRRAAKLLRYVGLVRELMGLEFRSTLTLELESENGALCHVHTSNLAAERSRYGLRTAIPTVLPGNVGYLRLGRMSDDIGVRETVEQGMADVRRTRGLIIDLRGNGGGSRDLIRVLVPYFMAPHESPMVVNAALYKRAPLEPEPDADGYLADRYLYRRSWPHWTTDERSALESFLTRFSPEWLPPSQEGFSDWHYMIVSRPQNGPDYYERPVIVLVDEDCFSATEILLSALKGRPNTLLVGATSAGGSGRPRGFTLPRSRLRVQASTMVSYRANGSLIQGRGISPDVEVVIEPSDWVGATDSALQRALFSLRSS